MTVIEFQCSLKHPSLASQLVELLERESSVMLYDKDAGGNTALHWAATQGHDQVGRQRKQQEHGCGDWALSK